MTNAPDFRALCEELLDELQYQTSYETNAELQDRARAALATPPPEPPTDEELLALKEKLWDKYKTIPYQWEEFMYSDAFKSALSDYRAVLERWAQR
jgi:hypothetical protein